MPDKHSYKKGKEVVALLHSAISKRVLSAMLAIWLIAPAAAAYASLPQEQSTGEGFLSDIYSASGLEEFSSYTSSQSFIEMFGYTNALDFIRDIFSGKQALSLTSVWQAIAGSLGSEVRGLISLILEVVLLAALCGLLQSVNTSYLSPKIRESAFYTVYLSLGAIVLKTYFDSIRECTAVFTNLVGFMNVAVPVFVLLLMFNGGIVSAGLMSPTLLFMTNMVTYILQQTVIPIIGMLIILYFISHLLSDVNISFLTGFIKDAASFVVGGALSAFTGFVAIQGITFASVDGAAVDTVKYAAKNLVPFVGSFLYNSFETIQGYALVIKNSTGLLSMLVIFSIAALPVVKLFMVFLALKLSAILVQPFTDSKFSSFVDEAAGCLLFVDMCILAIGVLFVIMTALFMLVGNYLAMLR